MSVAQPSVDIALATYQGEAYLEDLLRSLCAQSCLDFRIVVRDDGSRDHTGQILSAFQKNSPGPVRILADNAGKLGAAGNFARVIEACTADYVMLCDQDDVWHERKVELTLERMRACEAVRGSGHPLLVHTDLAVVDRTLQPISSSFWRYQNIHPAGRESVNRLLVQNVVTGCTLMMNRALKELALPIPGEACMHDWWIALVAAAFGQIVHLPIPTVLYRQHGGNDTGAKRWDEKLIVRRALGDRGQVRRQILKTQRQAALFATAYRERLPDQVLEMAAGYSVISQRPYLQRIALLLKHRMFKAGLVRNLGFFLRI